jgi:hypothetical protein
MKRREFVLGTAAGAGMMVLGRAHATSQPCPISPLQIDNSTFMKTCGNGNSALAVAARAMTAGTWSALSPANMSSVLGVGDHTGNMIPYCNAASWNPVLKCIEILGQDHGWGNMRQVQYDEASNAFVFVGNIGTDQGHGYDHYEVNPFNGDLYYKPYWGGTGGVIWRKPVAGSWNQNLAIVPTYQQVASGTCWWKGSFSGVGAQGAFMIYNLQGDGDIQIFDAASNSFLTGISSVAPGVDSYHGVMAYSAVKNVAVYGGGNSQPQKVYRLNSNRTLTNMPDAPGSALVGIYRGGLACDPVSGNFLLLSGGNLYELNPSGSGTWTQLGGSRIPPSAVNDPAASENMVMCELPEHGVIAVISMTTSNGTMYIYKHA